jgi:hypothetical protein
VAKYFIIIILRDYCFHPVSIQCVADIYIYIYIYIPIHLYIWNSESLVEIKDKCVAHKVDNLDKIVPKCESQIPVHGSYVIGERK